MSQSAVLRVAITGTLIALGMVTTASPALAAPNLHLPFPCGQQWRLDTWAHAPALDMVKEPDQHGTDGATLVAPAAGTVNQSFYHSNAGNVIQINHGGGYFTTYLHLESRAVSVGARVSMGTTIGRVGKTGPTSNGHPHLHFELGYDADGSGSASWGTAGSERVRPTFNGVTYGGSNGQTWRNVTSRNCSSPGLDAPAMMRDDGDGSMTIYRWTSSGSAFGRASDYTSGGWTMSNTGDRVASGDVDGDGKDDVVAAYQNSDGTFSYHVWKNGVSYAGKWYTSGPYALGPVGGRLVVADFNGDGKAEPAMMRDDGDGSMTIYRWTSSGSAFGRASDYTSGGWTMSNVGDRVASGDVDGDGKDDIVATYQNSDGTFSYHVWKNGVSYAGKWYTSGPYALGPVDGRLVVADLTGDGKAEPAMMRDDGDGSMTIYRWTSSGSAFGRASDYTSGGWTMSNVGNRVASGDVDGDGKDDVVATYQNSDGTFSYHVWKNGVSYAGKWYTSGPYSLGPVDGRLVLGNW
ncbi:MULTISPECIES: M23 family metallopeptidase [Nonomuraea]|uniref:M23 family metallopeptidase n=1 Tax=Nonomuraea ferruginea TaxID=46174 RepID=A0ABT4T671_9ACTN|nr:M23 family metallopeptidase [Nonomuraea ferruginea]MDA0644977.1 M23 family metallopeptidase [Nonomuraea ferruginea]